MTAYPPAVRDALAAFDAAASSECRTDDWDKSVLDTLIEHYASLGMPFSSNDFRRPQAADLAALDRCTEPRPDPRCRLHPLDARQYSRRLRSRLRADPGRDHLRPPARASASERRARRATSTKSKSPCGLQAIARASDRKVTRHGLHA